MEFKEVEIRNLYPVREFVQSDKSQYFHFYKSHNHNIKDYIKLNDVVEKLIKKGYFLNTPRMARGAGKTLKKKESLKKIVKVVAGGKGKDVSIREEKGHKRMHQYITSPSQEVPQGQATHSKLN